MRDRRPSRGATVALVVVASGIAGWVVVTSAFFDIRRIEVDGNRRISDERVVELAGASVGANLITTSMSELERGLRRSPWFARVAATRRLPSTLVLTVQERRPVAYARDPEGLAVVAGDGAVLERAAAAPAGLVDLGRSQRPLPPGGALRGLDDALRVAASFPASLRRAVASARATRGQVELELHRGGVVLYGRVEALRAKNAALSGILRYASREGIAIESIDVRAPTAPALKPAGPAGEDRSRTTPG